ncbi:hypothetical protein SAMN06265375_10123 [Muriicola jejuensis]|nr:hypothetical protein SAMN06265375_10123 [Muriicola jejuensis]
MPQVCRDKTVVIHFSMRMLISLVIVILVSWLTTQTGNEKLVGKWQCYHEDLEDDTTTGRDIFTDQEFEFSCNGMIIQLNSDLTGWEALGEQEFVYKLIDSILRMGSRYYVVELLTEKQMILRDHDPDSLSLFYYRRKYNRIK